MMPILKKIMLLVGCWLFITHSALAETQNPLDLIQGTVTALQEEVNAAQPGLIHHPEKLYRIVKQTIMPYVAIDEMAGLALGPKWRNATPSQKQQFIDRFGFLLTKTYANALLTVSNYKISLNPLRSDAWKTASYVAVTGEVASGTNNEHSHLTYYLERDKDSWKVYDLAIEGVSFLKNYQDQFRSFNDMASLLAKLDAGDS